MISSEWEIKVAGLYRVRETTCKVHGLHSLALETLNTTPPLGEWWSLADLRYPSGAPTDYVVSLALAQFARPLNDFLKRKYLL